MEFHVSGSLELLEDHLVHPGSGIDQRRGKDCQAATFLDVPGRTEEALRSLQCAGVDSTGEDPARVGGFIVVGPAQTSDRIEQDHHITAILNQSPRLLDDHLCHLNMTTGRFVEGGGDHLSTDIPLHVRHFFGAFVDQQHHQIHIRMIGCDGIGDQLQDDGLTGPGRSHDQAALSLTDRGHQIDDSGLDDIGIGLHQEAIIGIERGEVIEHDLRVDIFRILVIDGIDLEQGKVPFTFLGGAYLSLDDGTGDQSKTSDL